jgi:hypothetical protein
MIWKPTDPFFQLHAYSITIKMTITLNIINFQQHSIHSMHWDGKMAMNDEQVQNMKGNHYKPFQFQSRNFPGMTNKKH